MKTVTFVHVLLRRSIVSKGILYAALFCGLNLLQAQAQDDKLQGGIKGGVNLSNFYTNDVDDNNAKIGFNAGLFLKTRLTSFLAIQPELLYSLQGNETSYKGTLLTSPGKIRFNMSYVNLPVLLVVNPVKNFNIHAGPYVGVLVASKIKDIDDDGSTDNVKELDRDDFNTLDYGIAGGIGFDFDAGTVGLRYNYGLNEVGKDGTRLGEALRGSKNSVFQLYVGFGF